MSITPSRGLRGEVTVPGDKSISHRAVMLGAIADGVSQVDGFLDSADCRSTMGCFAQMGVEMTLQGGTLTVRGRGLRGLSAPQRPLDAGNSGTTTRLLTGLLAGQGFDSELFGDASLSRRPMDRVIHPLTQMGARIDSAPGGRCPLRIHGQPLHGIAYTLPVASAQLKSALILAGLYAQGETVLTEPAPSRDHTERMLAALGAELTEADGRITVHPARHLPAFQLTVPGDISSAAFFLVAGLIVPNSEVTLRGVGCNPTRTGLIDVLLNMGADLTIENRRGTLEPVCDLTVRTSALNGVRVDGALIPRLIDEIPALAVAAAFAQGETVIADAQELKVKESNRIRAMTEQLRRAGADVTETEDGMIIRGGRALHGAHFQTYGDHRIAMAMAVCALACQGPSTLEEEGIVAISYPGFFQTLRTLEGGRV